MNNEIILAPLVSMVYFILAFYILVGIFITLGDAIMSGENEVINYLDYLFGILYTLYKGE